jgi:hypothetical protein
VAFWVAVRGGATVFAALLTLIASASGVRGDVHDRKAFSIIENLSISKRRSGTSPKNRI